MEQDIAINTGTGIGIFLVIGFFALLAIASLILWVWSLIDCVSKEPSEGNDKIIWVLLIVFLGPIASLLYVFVRRPQRIREHGK